MSAERNPAIRQMAKDLKRARALAITHGVEVALIEAWYAGAAYGMGALARTITKPTKGARK